MRLLGQTLNLTSFIGFRTTIGKNGSYKGSNPHRIILLSFRLSVYLPLCPTVKPPFSQERVGYQVEICVNYWSTVPWQ